MGTELLQIDHLINGEWVSSADRRIHHDPGLLSDAVQSVAQGDAGTVDQAVQAAHAAFPGWSSLSAADRVHALSKATERLADSHDLTELLVREHGGVRWEAETDFYLGAGVLGHTMGLTEGFFQPVVYDDETSTISIERVPRGVVAAIVPWNMPVVLTMMKLAPALATGNTVVLKPSPFAAGALTQALQRMSAELPPGVINVVHGEGDVGAALTSHALVRKVAFTGGTETAKHVMRSAADSIKNVTLELGGNDPAVVLDDADIDSTLDRMLKGVFTRTGQICFAVKRIYVPAAMAQAFTDRLCERVAEYQVGHGLDPQASFGPLNNEGQYKKVLAIVEGARAGGLDVVELGNKLDPDGWDNGYYVLPHVIRGADHNAPVSSCEQFGPVIPVIAYQDEAQVVEWANDSDYGLGSSVWTSDAERGFGVARQIQAGSTFINTHSFESLDLRMPFGGVKQSGIGREFGEAGLGEYVEEHAIRLLK